MSELASPGVRPGSFSEITTVVYVPCDRYVSVPSYDSWWDVPVAEVSEMEGVRAARTEWERMRAMERLF